MEFIERYQAAIKQLMDMPLHFNCRSITMEPIMPTEFLGLGEKMKPAKTIEKMTKKEFLEIISHQEDTISNLRENYSKTCQLLGKAAEARDALQAQNMHLKTALSYQLKSAKNLIKGITS